MVPGNWATDVGRSLAATPTGERWTRFPTWLTNIGPDGNPLPPGQHRYVFIDQYERALRPELLDSYVNRGYCWVVLGSLQAGRAFAQPQDAPQAVAYYAAAGQPGQARIPREPVPPEGPPGPVQLRLVDRLLPSAIHPSGPRDERLPPDRGQVLLLM